MKECIKCNADMRQCVICDNSCGTYICVKCGVSQYTERGGNIIQGHNPHCGEISSFLSNNKEVFLPKPRRK